MMAETMGTPVIMGNGGEGFGGNSIWAFLLLALFGFGGNGFGGGRTYDQSLWQSQQFTQIDNGIRGLANGICDSAYALNNSIRDNGFILQGKVDQTRFDLAQCCCETNRNIDSVNYNIERSSNAIVQSGNANTQKILDYLCASEKNQLASKLAEANQALSEARIIGAMKPQAPIPAYTVPSPYAQYGCGGCGFYG